MDDINISVADFVKALFEPNETETVCMAQAIEWTDAHGVRQSAYRHHPYTEHTPAMIERTGGAWYVCASTVLRVLEGQKLRRRKQDCTATMVLMLDDIGTKINREELDARLAAAGLKPSAILETSPGNFQYLFLIEPVEDGAHFEACNRAIVSAGLGDAGATGVSRVFRIPGSINTKPGNNNFACRVTAWAPDRIYDLDDIMRRLKLEPAPRQVQAKDFEGIEVPEDFDDAGLQWLESKGLVIGYGLDFITIKCPNAHEHTDGNPGAGYSPVGHGAMPIYRTFHCMHEHCTGWDSHRLLAWMAEQGGPTLANTGVAELRRDELLSYVDELTTAEKVELVDATLPPLFPGRLPDAKFGKPDKFGNAPADKVQAPTRANIEYIMEQYGIRTRFNMMRHAVEFEFVDPERAFLVTGNAEAEIQQLLIDGALRVGINRAESVLQVAEALAGREKYHPMEEWILSAKWDGVSRIGALAASVTPQDAYTEAWPLYLRRWLLQTVQAVCGWREPQQISTVLVLSGPQGAMKTSWLASLVPPEWFAEGVQLDLKSHGASRDSIMAATAKPIIELGELEVTFRKADAGALKAFLSKTEDTYRSPYGRKPESWPRCTSISASVNRDAFLVDDTGSRRFIPTSVVRCDPNHCIDMLQLWAEVYTLWRAGERWWLTEEEDVMRAKQAEEFRIIESAEEKTAEYLSTHEGGEIPMTRTAFCEHIGVIPNNKNLAIVGDVLKRFIGPSRRSLENVQNAWPIPLNRKKLLNSVLNRDAAKSI